VSKKILVALVLLLLLSSLAGCKVNQEGTTPNLTSPNPSSQKPIKLIRIESDPEGATVYIDKSDVLITPGYAQIQAGKHTIQFSMEGYEDKTLDNIDIEEDTKVISANLRKVPEEEIEMMEYGPTGGPIVFHSGPNFNSCIRGVPAYSNIFYGETLTVEGVTVLDEFDIVFPSGKKVHFDTEKVSDKVRKFSKVVTFDELGGYKIIANGETKYGFEVHYKPTLLPPTPKLTDMFLTQCKDQFKNAIAVPVGGEVEAKVLITNADGKPIPNTSLGVYGLKTDKNGIVTFKVKIERVDNSYKTYVNGQEVQFYGGLMIYGDIYVWGYDYAKYSKDGKLISYTPGSKSQDLYPNFVDELPVVSDGNSTYVQLDALNIRLNEIYRGTGIDNDIILPHPEDPSVIYTKEFVSKDGGKHFKKMSETLDIIALNPKNPNEVFGYVLKDKTGYILRSEDFGQHFEKTKIENVNFSHYFVSNLFIDQDNPQKVYLVTQRGLYVSGNGGKDFALLYTDPSQTFPVAVAISPANSDLILLSGAMGIVKSSDGGKTWKIVKKNDNENLQYVNYFSFADPKKPNEVFAAVRGEELIVSYDEGENWQPFCHCTYDVGGRKNVDIKPFRDTYKICTVSSNNVYVSNDGGKTFKSLDFPVKGDVFVNIGADGRLYILIDGIPFVENGDGTILPLDGETFLAGGPNWKIINKKFYIEVKDVKGEQLRIKETNDGIVIYRMCDMLMY